MLNLQFSIDTAEAAERAARVTAAVAAAWDGRAVSHVQTVAETDTPVRGHTAAEAAAADTLPGLGGDPKPRKSRMKHAEPPPEAVAEQAVLLAESITGAKRVSVAEPPPAPVVEPVAEQPAPVVETPAPPSRDDMAARVRDGAMEKGSLWLRAFFEKFAVSRLSELSIEQLAEIVSDLETGA